MLTHEENERLTRVGPGTPMGELMRRYWQPIGAETEMTDRWTKRVRLLGEDLVLFKNRVGAFGLIGEQCPHRRASMAYGIPTEDGIRCPYHGWKFDAAGSCLEMPNEPEGSTFKDKVALPGYPVRELGGMLWAYLGPQPAPLLPRLDGFVEARTIRCLGWSVVPCNWLQMMENSLDPCHTEWLHGNFVEFVFEKDGAKVPASRHTTKIGFDEFEYGIIKRRLLVGQTEDSEDWKVGHPVVFPNTLAIGIGSPASKLFAFQIRVPIDDTHTMHYWYNAFVPPAGAEVPERLYRQFDVYEVPFQNDAGEYLVEFTHAQDIMAWVTQGAIADRTLEALGATDRGVTLYRKMLFRELERVARGEDPKCVLRDPAQNERIDLPLETQINARSTGFAAMARRHNLRFSGLLPDLIAIYDRPAPTPVA